MPAEIVLVMLAMFVGGVCKGVIGMHTCVYRYAARVQASGCNGTADLSHSSHGGSFHHGTESAAQGGVRMIRAVKCRAERYPVLLHSIPDRF